MTLRAGGHASTPGWMLLRTWQRITASGEEARPFFLWRKRSKKTLFIGGLGRRAAPEPCGPEVLRFLLSGKSMLLTRADARRRVEPDPWRPPGDVAGSQGRVVLHDDPGLAPVASIGCAGGDSEFMFGCATSIARRRCRSLTGRGCALGQTGTEAAEDFDDPPGSSERPPEEAPSFPCRFHAETPRSRRWCRDPAGMARALPSTRRRRAFGNLLFGPGPRCPVRCRRPLVARVRGRSPPAGPGQSPGLPASHAASAVAGPRADGAPSPSCQASR